MKSRCGITLHPGIFILSLALAFGLGLALGFGLNPGTPKVSLNVAVVRCTEVLDGDTIRVDWQGTPLLVRLLGLDCLEIRRGRKFDQQMAEFGLEDWAVENTGKLAKARVEAQALNRMVTLVFPGSPDQRDAFGRLLAYLEVDDRDIGLLLLTSGLAYEFPTDHPRQAQYQEATEEARRRRLGVWANRP